MTSYQENLVSLNKKIKFFCIFPYITHVVLFICISVNLLCSFIFNNNFIDYLFIIFGIFHSIFLIIYMKKLYVVRNLLTELKIKSELFFPPLNFSFNLICIILYYISFIFSSFSFILVKTHFIIYLIVSLILFFYYIYLIIISGIIIFINSPSAFRNLGHKTENMI